MDPEDVMFSEEWWIPGHHRKPGQRWRFTYFVLVLQCTGPILTCLEPVLNIPLKVRHDTHMGRVNFLANCNFFLAEILKNRPLWKCVHSFSELGPQNNQEWCISSDTVHSFGMLGSEMAFTILLSSGAAKRSWLQFLNQGDEIHIKYGDAGETEIWPLRVFGFHAQIEQHIRDYIKGIEDFYRSE